MNGLSGKVREMNDTLDIGTLLATGWKIGDLPRSTKETWQELMEVMGEGNFHVLAVTVSPTNSIRGQIIISQVGISNLKTHYKDTQNDD